MVITSKSVQRIRYTDTIFLNEEEARSGHVHLQHCQFLSPDF